ncbi:MAG: MgtC/SapB family protein [Alphaproteobacteria bacterium]|nr:MgtC/SapB family protein [Alphaproteobacteria bacterium]
MGGQAQGAGDAMTIDPRVMSFTVALGIGLLIGAERERHKGKGPSRAAAGVRTFALVSLAGAVSLSLGDAIALAVTLAGVAVLATAGYRNGSGGDPGLTTEISLVLTTLLGALSMKAPALAAGLAVAVAVLLATRSPLHRFVQAGFTDAEARDALILASAALVVLPLLPDRTLGPFNAFNPHAIWLVVVLVLAIGAAGHVAVRLVGERFGLPIAGFASGFVSSVATIGALGARARETPTALGGAAAGAILSTVATILQMGVVIGATSMPTLRALTPSLAAAGVAAIAYAAIFTVLLIRRDDAAARAIPVRAFSLTGALTFAATVASVMLAAAALKTWYGGAGVLAAAALAGFADTHSAAISVAALVADGKLPQGDAILPILAAFLTNTISKAAFAVSSGGRAYALRVIPGLILVGIAALAGAYIVPR